MTFVPENATLCACWRDASYEERAVALPHLTFSPRGLRSCPCCRGAGWYVTHVVLRLTADAAEYVLDAANAFDPGDKHELHTGIASEINRQLEVLTSGSPEPR